MSRIRTIKPEFFKHEEIFEAEKNSDLPLRLAFIGLWLTADREGRFKFKPRQLKIDILPYDEHIDFEKTLNALEAYGFIKKYECGGEIYGFIPTWHKHQRVNNRESASVLPSPESGSLLSSATPASRVTDPSTTRESGRLNSLKSAQGEGEGKGKGKGKEGR